MKPNFSQAASPPTVENIAADLSWSSVHLRGAASLFRRGTEGKSTVARRTRVWCGLPTRGGAAVLEKSLRL